MPAEVRTVMFLLMGEFRKVFHHWPSLLPCLQIYRQWDDLEPIFQRARHSERMRFQVAALPLPDEASARSLNLGHGARGRHRGHANNGRTWQDRSLRKSGPGMSHRRDFTNY